MRACSSRTTCHSYLHCGLGVRARIHAVVCVGSELAHELVVGKKEAQGFFYIALCWPPPGRPMAFLDGRRFLPELQGKQHIGRRTQRNHTLISPRLLSLLQGHVLWLQDCLVCFRAAYFTCYKNDRLHSWQYATLTVCNFDRLQRRQTAIWHNAELTVCNAHRMQR